jgi:hypothetical protein
MAPHGLSRPPGPVQRQPPPAFHDVRRADLCTGTLELLFTTGADQWVSPGSGRLTLTENDQGEVVAQEAARRNGRPVLPGSGIKGAVRTVYELLSFSCDPFAREGCSASSCCDACSLFGCLGWAGRASFADAAPVGSVQTLVAAVPIAHEPHGEKTGGQFRFYDLRDAAGLQGVPRDKELAREVYRGTFAGRLTFWNVSQEELGRLLCAMGSGYVPAVRFPLRLGGVKYDGKGAVEVGFGALALASPVRQSFARGEEVNEQCSAWLQAAQSSPWGQTFRATLESLARVLTTAA